MRLEAFVLLYSHLPAAAQAAHSLYALLAERSVAVAGRGHSRRRACPAESRFVGQRSFTDHAPNCPDGRVSSPPPTTRALHGTRQELAPRHHPRCSSMERLILCAGRTAVLNGTSANVPPPRSVHPAQLPVIPTADAPRPDPRGGSAAGEARRRSPTRPGPLAVQPNQSRYHAIHRDSRSWASFFDGSDRLRSLVRGIALPGLAPADRHGRTFPLPVTIGFFGRG